MQRCLVPLILLMGIQSRVDQQPHQLAVTCDAFTVYRQLQHGMMSVTLQNCMLFSCGHAYIFSLYTVSAEVK